MDNCIISSFTVVKPLVYKDPNDELVTANSDSANITVMESNGIPNVTVRINNSSTNVTIRVSNIYTSVTVELNSDATVILFCLAFGTPTYSWERNDKNISPDAGLDEINKNSLILHNISPKHDGKYRCKVKNRNGASYSGYTVINVKG